MVGVWNIGQSDSGRDYDILGDPRRFTNMMGELKGARYILSLGRSDNGVFPTQTVYHIQPEGVTLHYKYLNLGRADLNFEGRRESVSRVKKRIRALFD